MALTREEKLERRRRYRLANRERLLAEAAEYRAKNSDKVRAAQKRWYGKAGAADARARYMKNPAANRAATRKWLEEHPDYFRVKASEAYYADIDAGRARCRAYRQQDVERHRRRCSDWIRANPDKGRAKAHRYRARKIDATVEVFSDLEIFERDGWRCYICGVEVTVAATPTATDRAVLDHVIALSKGGAHSGENSRCACFPCNTMKGARLTPEQTRARLRDKAAGHGPQAASIDALNQSGRSRKAG